MKMLTIHDHQTSESDFCWGVEGEIAVPGPVTCHRRDCGCDRSHTGLNSHKASTTVIVRDVDLDFDDLVTAAVGFLESAGWAAACGDHGKVDAAAREMVAAAAEVAAEFEVGAVLRPAFDRDCAEWRYTAAEGDA